MIVTDSKNEPSRAASSVRIELSTPDRSRALFSPDALNRARHRGGAVPLSRGRHRAAMPLRYVVDTPIGSTEFTQQVRLEDKVSILLTTEKPIYQPGQTIHVRALALDRANHEAAAGRKLTFEVEDSRGNKVFKKATQTDKFGIASAEFGLADEVNLGTYHLRAVMDDGRPKHGEIALNVERYVLPKFKVAVEFAGKGKGEARLPAGRPRDGHRPRQLLLRQTGGRRGDHGQRRPAWTWRMFEAGSAQGKTDADGAYRFDLKLPNYFAGRPLSQGAARVLIEATVKDSAGHAETRGEPITVSESPLIMTAVPEGGTLIPDLENQVFILTSYADGKPAIADRQGPRRREPRPERDHRRRRRRRDPPEGRRGHADAARSKPTTRKAIARRIPCTSTSRAASDQILLRTERAVYRAGDRIQLRIFSTKKQRHRVRGCRQGRPDRAHARPGYRERPGGACAHRHAGPGGHARFQRVPVRPRRAARRRSPAGLRAAGGRAEDRGDGGRAASTSRATRRASASASPTRAAKACRRRSGCRWWMRPSSRWRKSSRASPRSSSIWSRK